jgi:predicted DNA-binding protein (MmcQ/YjbR family)
MNVEDLREYCLVKKAVTESFPFDETTLVFKVMNKMFCLLSLNKIQVNLKNSPDKNIDLRAHYSAIIPGYHMNKEHWNTIELDGSVPPKLIKQLIDESYILIVKSLPKKKQEEFKNL